MAQTAAPDLPLSHAERHQAEALMERTAKDFTAALAGLSDAQLHFKAAPDRWSILECAEHIATVEALVAGQVIGKTLQAPAQPARRVEIKALDAQILAGLEDRTHKFTAPEMIVPHGKLKDVPAVQEAFAAARKVLGAALEKGDGLRVRVVPHPVFGSLDLYQWILLAAAHTSRHLQQIAEVKAAPGYPAK